MDKIPIQLNVVMTSVSIGSEICIKIKRRRDWFSFLALSLSLSLVFFVVFEILLRLFQEVSSKLPTWEGFVQLR